MPGLLEWLGSLVDQLRVFGILDQPAPRPGMALHWVLLLGLCLGLMPVLLFYWYYSGAPGVADDLDVLRRPGLNCAGDVASIPGEMLTTACAYARSQMFMQSRTPAQLKTVHRSIITRLRRLMPDQPEDLYENAAGQALAMAVPNSAIEQLVRGAVIANRRDLWRMFNWVKRGILQLPWPFTWLWSWNVPV